MRLAFFRPLREMSFRKVLPAKEAIETVCDHDINDLFFWS